MKHSIYSIPYRAAELLSRARTLMLVFVATIATAVWSQTEGPWTYLSYRSAFTNFDQYNSTAYYYLGWSAWGDCSVEQYHDDNGLGFRVKGNSSAGEKNCVFSVYVRR